MKRVLVISYYWPPSGGSGVQRWLKCVKYLREFGWEPIVYTADNPEYPVIDASLSAEVPQGVEVIRRKIWEPYKLFKLFTGQKQNQRVVSGFLRDKRPSVTARISMWLRGNIFIPDARRFWIRPSTTFLLRYLKEHKVDAIVSTGPPHSMHLIASNLHSKTKTPWLADFRDPWTNIDFYDELMLSRMADRKHHRLEKMVVSSANAVVVVGETMKEEYEHLSGRKIDVITNGYDDEDLKPQSKSSRDRQFTILHIGMLNKHRNHESFWDALASLAESEPHFAEDLKVKLVGKADVAALESIKRTGLSKNVEHIEYLPHHEAVMQQSKAQVLLLSINDTPNAKGVITGKIFEYLAARRPVLCIGPEDGDAAAILNHARAGLIAGFHDVDKLKGHLRHFYQLYRQNELEVEGAGIEEFSRKALTGKFAKLLDSITS